jgi:hypothetical protein
MLVLSSIFPSTMLYTSQRMKNVYQELDGRGEHKERSQRKEMKDIVTG